MTASEKKRIPLFSIVIPVYNAEKSISRALNSIENQTFQDFELILINDGSTDNSLDVMTSYSNDHLVNYPVMIVTQDNSGAGSTRNKGINLASGKYLVFLDADDYLDCCFLEAVHESIEKDNSDVIFVDIIREDEKGIVIRKESMSSFASFSKEDLIRQQLTGKMPWGGVRKVVRLEVVKQNSIHFASIRVGEECIYSYEILKHSDVISFQNKALYHYVEMSNSLTSNDTVENSLSVFNYIRSYMISTNQYKLYEKTIRSIAVSAMVVIINVLTQTQRFSIAYKMSKKFLYEYSVFFKGKIDYLALDKRVIVCTPWVKAKLPLMIMLASTLKNITRGKSR